MAVKIKRIYEEANKTDGYRVLVDRLWSRGVSKEEAQLDLWLKEVAPSTELREWFGHDPAKMTEFSNKYQHELRHNPAFTELQKIVKEKSTVTLLYGAKDEKVNHAVVLQKALS